MPTPHATDASTRGDEMTLRSRTIAARRAGSSGAAQAALPVSRAQARSPAPCRVRPTDQPLPSWPSNSAAARRTSAPVRAAGPRRSGVPASSGRTVEPSAGAVRPVSVPGAVVPRTGWTVSWAVRPRTSAASSGSSRPGSSTTMRWSPARERFGSLTPRASTRRRSTSRVRSVASRSASAVGESRVSSTSWVPPRRSRPSRAGWVSARNVERARIASANSARTLVARVKMPPAGMGGPRVRP